MKLLNSVILVIILLGSINAEEFTLYKAEAHAYYYDIADYGDYNPRGNPDASVCVMIYRSLEKIGSYSGKSIELENIQLKAIQYDDSKDPDFELGTLYIAESENKKFFAIYFEGYDEDNPEKVRRADIKKIQNLGESPNIFATLISTTYPTGGTTFNKDLLKILATSEN